MQPIPSLSPWHVAKASCGLCGLLRAVVVLHQILLHRHAVDSFVKPFGMLAQHSRSFVVDGRIDCMNACSKDTSVGWIIVADLHGRFGWPNSSAVDSAVEKVLVAVGIPVAACWGYFISKCWRDLLV